ncbi:MAG: acyl-ACP--UDP-N-acetylglucosamine O-acyltransferase [Candidatus Omnitrophota bacterium]
MGQTTIHPTAVIDPGAVIGEGVQIGPYTVIGPNVVIKNYVHIMSHCHIEGRTTIGQRTRVFPGAVIGTPPQDKKFKEGDEVYLQIGENNILREHVMINPGTLEGGGKTVIGNNNLFMAYSHVAHDCKIGNNCTFANVATIAGHVFIDDFVIVGGLTGVHQFVRIGKYTIVGGCSRVSQDVVPFAMCSAAETHVCGVNIIGLKRAGFSPEHIQNIKRSFKLLFFSELSYSHALERIENELEMDENVSYLIEFVKSSERGLMGGK